ncbi:MAG TPA: ABC transporter substrate-binding protein [Tepidiformaceae bacterium]|nr:ABC transporter substrate-binding protein [Tepidiformaceae bacterium]
MFSRLLTYENLADGMIRPDLATRLPEQPDALTYAFQINPAATWQNRAPLNGRAVTANDVKVSIERQRDGGPAFLRTANWANVEAIETPDDRTLTVRIKSPLAAMPHFFADVSAFIVAPELVADGALIGLDQQVGSGPFEWVEWSDREFASLSRNRTWWGGNERPFLDGVTLEDVRDATELEGLLRTHRLDLAFVRRALADELKAGISGLQESSVGLSRFWGMRFFAVVRPWDDPRVRTAVTIALDRRAMLEQFFEGEGELNPWVSWPMKRWTLPQSELQTLPGYRVGAAGRQQDINDAQSMLAAYTSGGQTIPELGLVVPDDGGAGPGFGAMIRDQLQQTLGLNIVPYPVDPARLGPAILNNDFPWVAWPDDGNVDLDDWVYPYFHSQGTKNTFPLRDADTDSLIERQRLELDEDARRAIGFDIQRRMLQLNVGVNLVSERLIALSRPYVRDFPLDVADGYQQRFADTWIDRADASYRAT